MTIRHLQKKKVAKALYQKLHLIKNYARILFSYENS